MKPTFLILSLLCLIPTPSRATSAKITTAEGNVASATAKLAAVEGNVKWSKSDIFKPVKPHQMLDSEDTIMTGEDGIAIIQFEDGSEMKLNPLSTLTIGSGDVPKSDTEVILLRGAVLSKISPQKSGHFKLKTKTATMGVRGTTFFTGYGYTEKDANEVKMAVNEGLVAVSDAKEPNKEAALVKPGEGIVAQAGKKIEAPKVQEWMKELNWKMDKSPVLTTYKMPAKRQFKFQPAPLKNKVAPPANSETHDPEPEAPKKKYKRDDDDLDRPFRDSGRHKNKR